jgi:hypothetical protein
MASKTTIGNRVARFEMVLVQSKVHYKSTSRKTERKTDRVEQLQSSSVMMNITAVKTARVPFLSGLKTRSFPAYRVFL